MSKTVIISCLALILNGCTTIRRDSVPNVDPQTVELPIKFSGYREFYAFVAQRTYGGMPTNAETLFKLAADSRTEIVTVEDKELSHLYLVESHYYNGGIYDQIRGTQGNGDYYLLRPLSTNHTEVNTDKGFELIGIAEGNSCELTYSNGTPRFVTHWHLSASESPESVYQWNGKFFEKLK